MPSVPYCRSLVALVASLSCGHPAAQAQEPDVRASRAELLFTEGKAALAAGDLVAACSKLAESVQLEAATGGSLALAMCHERQHRYILARSEYEQVRDRSLQEGRVDRARVAHQKLAELTAKISNLTIYTTLAEGSAMLTVRVNGLELTPQQLVGGVPVEGGAVLVEASAPGRQSWRGSVTVSELAHPLYLTVPALAPLPAIAQPQSHVEVSQPVAVSQRSPDRRSGALTASGQPRTSGRRRPRAFWATTALLSSATVGLVLAGGYTFKAIRLNRRSEDGCEADVCSAAGRGVRLDARRAGTIASATLAAGSALAVAGMISYLVGRRAKSDERIRPALQASGWVSGHTAGVLMRGSFR